MRAAWTRRVLTFSRVGRKIALTLLLGTLLAGCSAGKSQKSGAPVDFPAAIASIRERANSYIGLSIEDVRRRMQDAPVKEDDWGSGGAGGKMLTATFPQYEVRVLFSQNRAITASVHVMSE